MLLLVSTSDLLQVVFGQTASAISMYSHASYVDNNAGTITPGNQNQTTTTATGGTTTTTVVSSPGSSVQRNVKALLIQNGGTVPCQVTIQLVNASSTSTLYSYNMQPNETLQYFDGSGFEVIDAAGGRKVSPAAGRLVTITYHTATGAGTHTMANSTNFARILIVGGGGGGGGCAGNTGNASFSGGGAGGGYTEVYTPVTGGVTYNFNIGAGGQGGTNNANGNNGSNSNWTGNASNATVVWTAQGGANGQFMANGLTFTFGVGGALTPANTSNNPNVAATGAPGGASWRNNGTAGYSGWGGAAGGGYGGGTNGIYESTGASAPGTAGQNYGGGGCGATSNANANGGNGAGGLIIVEEYT